MATWKNGLRAKSMLALALAGLLALVPAGLLGWQVLDGVRSYFGESYARNFTQLKRQSILAPVTRDLALSARLADSVLTRQWLLDEGNPEKKALFFAEAEGYRKDLRDHNYFFVSAKNRNFYFNDGTKPFSDQPRYTLDLAKSSSAWFFSTLTASNIDNYNINVNYDPVLQVTKVWANIIIRNGEDKIGVVGSGLDLSSFLNDFIATSDPGVTPIILNQAGAIQAHPNPKLIAIDMTATSPAWIKRWPGNCRPARSVRRWLQRWPRPSPSRGRSAPCASRWTAKSNCWRCPTFRSLNGTSSPQWT